MQTEDTRPLMVSIRCMVYNHEPYLRDCLDGFVMQKTNFRFEAIVHDDASTDGSAIIIREYAEKYPEIIKPIYETENQYSKHDGSLRRIMNEHTHGKYIAFCEGDDYWTDSSKLQKQVDFLKSHVQYSMCFHKVIEHYQDKSRIDSVFADTEERDYSGIEIYKKWIIQTASILIKKEVLDSEIYRKASLNYDFAFGDILIFLSSAATGKVRGLNEIMSVYRKHPSGMTSDLSFTNIKRNIKHNIAIYKVFGKQYKSIAKKKNSYEAYTLMRISMNHNVFVSFKYFLLSLLYSPSVFYKRTKGFIYRNKHV